MRCFLLFLVVLAVVKNTAAQSPQLVCWKNGQAGLCDTNGHVIKPPGPPQRHVDYWQLHLRDRIGMDDREQYWILMVPDSLLKKYSAVRWIDTLQGILLAEKKDTVYDYVDLHGHALFAHGKNFRPYLKEPRILDNRIAVYVDSSIGFINAKGKLLIPGPFRETGGFHHGRALCLANDTSIVLIDTNGHVLAREKARPHRSDIDPVNAPSLLNFHDGRVLVARHDTFAFMDTNGRVTLFPQLAGKVDTFHYGRVVYTVRGRRDTSTANMIDRNGKLVGKTWRQILAYNCNYPLWRVSDEQDRTSIIDSLGNVVFTESASCRFLCILNDGTFAVEDKQKGILRIDGAEKILTGPDPSIVNIFSCFGANAIGVSRKSGTDVEFFYYAFRGHTLTTRVYPVHYLYTYSVKHEGIWYTWRNELRRSAEM